MTYPIIPRVFASLAAILGSAFVAGGASAQGQVAPQSAPRPWLEFADSVNGKLIEWLRADEEAAVRFRTYVEGMQTGATASSPPVILQIWTDAKGVITAVQFPPFAHEEANADLRHLLIGKAVGANPPRGMLFPLRLAVQLDPAPSAEEGVNAAQP